MASPAPLEQDQFPSTVDISVQNRVLPGRERPTAVIRLDSRPSGGLVIWSSAALTQLRDAVDGIDQDQVEAIVVVGNRHSFGAGANLDEIRHRQEEGSAAEYIATGHEAFGRLAEAAVPTFSVLSGQALGGGLELALHTDHRIGHAGGGPLGLPECRLGIFPAWGGVYLLPHLIGPSAAIDAMVFNSVRGRHVRPSEALDLGLVDRLLDVGPDDDAWDAAWEPAVVDLLTQGEDDSQAPRGGAEQSKPDGGSWREAVDSARARAEAQWHGAAPAPLAALGLVAAAETQSRSESAAAATDSFGELVTGDIAKACLRTFRLVDGRSRRAPDRPDVPGREIRKVGVVGAGLMARQLAALFARSLRVPVVLTDIDQEQLANGVRWVSERFRRQADQGRMTPEEAETLAALVTGAASDADLADVDFLIEATPEDMKIKQAVLGHWAGVLRPDAVLATNTSSLSVTRMSEAVPNPERFVGFHVFNPVDSTPLLEIITTPTTDPETLSTAFDLAAAMRRTAVRVADAPGFVVNRILLRMFDPVLQAIDDGMDPGAADHALDSLGLPMTPLQLLDFVGPAVLHHVGETMHAAYPDRFHESPWMAEVVAQGITKVLPTKAGPAEGDTSDGDGQTAPPRPYLEGAAEAARVKTVPDPRSRARQGTVEPSALLRDVELALAEEIGIMLDEGVIARAEDVDVCMVLGANWPFYLGGITPHLDRVGATMEVLGRRFADAAKE